MPEIPFKIKLSSVSVVILAKDHNPTIVNPDFLKNHDIVGSDWEIADNQPSLTTPVNSIVSFKNGVQWDVNPERCTIKERVEGDFKDSYLIQNCTKKFVEVLLHVPYHAIGINWHIFFEFKNQEVVFTWFKRRFLKEGKWQNKIFPRNLGFQVGSDCTFFLDTKNLPVGRISVGCNFHTDIKNAENKVKSIRSVLGKIKKNQATLKKHLDSYFIGDLK
ncbi:MAG: hypothetical protein GKS04_01350 [Candidatus Mycalebacterium zealandia]|nr:MAG: hypothetical protein GKS04_01350 [Candidatus Mycalebacterium zealandia]